uniref:CCAAT-binding factor domain-containing protein n=1 Tax=Hyaloperonospora arabidopsidis (strain Emoy2) TaxID=559515 RepID=M4BDN2_HYAAE
MTSVAAIKQLEAKVKENVTQINELPKVVKALQHSDKAVVQAAMLSMRRVLLFFLEKGDLQLKPTEQEAAKKSKGNDGQAIDKFRRWIWDIYVNFLQKMLHWVGDAQTDSNLRVGALRTLMEFVSREGAIRREAASSFGNETFTRVVQNLVTTEKLKGELASVFQGEFVGAYMDVQYYMMLDHAHVQKDEDETKKLTLVTNALRMLGMVQMPDETDEISSFLVEPKDATSSTPEMMSSDDESDEEEKEVLLTSGSKRKAGSDSKTKKKDSRGLRSVKQHRYVFSLAWIAVLRHKLPQAAYRKLLVQLPDKIMPNLVNPLLLADFLTDSYEIGGVTSLLALNSLFILIQDYNFDSPDFYNKLYAMLDDPSLYSAKQRDRFFGLLNLFLSSTHLPAYTVAAFAKRLSRSALTAEPGAILFIIPMVYNLILRHKECLQLIHRTGSFTAAEKAAKRREELSSGTAVDAVAKRLSSKKLELILKNGHDPFINDELDPAKCNALQSSLWELYTMKHHYNADVALKARMFEEKLRHQFVDTDESMEINYKSLFEKQLKRKENGKVPLAFHTSKGLFANATCGDDSERKEEDNIFAQVFEL